MLFSSLLKGRVAESILITLLERAGYRVTRLGVEELFTEIRYLDIEQYLQLKLPTQLRSIPDLLVAEPQVTAAFLVEVKFRRRFDQQVAKELHVTLAEQRTHWPDSYAVIMLAEPAVPEGRFHQDYIRVLPPKSEEGLLAAPRQWPNDAECDRMRWLWDSLPQLQSVFNRFSQSADNIAPGFENQQHADFITRSLADLRHI